MCALYSGSPASVNPTCNDTRNPKITIFNGYSQFKDNIPEQVNYSDRGTRQAISKFTPRSRSNLLKRIFSLSSFPTLFVTLTYPKYFPADSKEWKRHLDNFRHELLIRYPNLWFFWKLEPQKRGAPHFHLIGSLGPKENVVYLRNYIAMLWFVTCGTGDPKHLKAGTQVDYIADAQGKMRSYVSKYIGKTDLANYEGWEHPGRFWGIIGRKNLPPILSIKVFLSDSQYYTVKRLVRRWLKRQSSRAYKFSKRLRSVASFPLFVSSKVIKKILTAVLDSLPDPLPHTELKSIPQPIFC